MEWLIKSYTNPGDLVLDNCCGSGTTCLAAYKTGRDYIGMEIEEEYYNIALDRMKEEQKYIRLL
jgi:site-specific DNA-methyltransferase (adenine-specific)